MFNIKRTRSQLILPDLDHDIFARSPLKDARSVLRNTSHTAVQNESPGMDVTPDVDPSTGRHKRPFSPLKDSLIEWERVLKRQKREGSDSENEVSPRVQKGFPKKPSSLSSFPSTRSSAVTPGRQRARSVPVGPIPFVDLKLLSSPSRSPSRSKQQLKFTTLPSMGSIRDETLIDDSPIPQTSCASGSNEVVCGPSSAAGISVSIPTSVSEDVNMSSPTLSPPPTSPVQVATSPPAPVTPLLPEQDLSRPLSPLTPLPPTPRSSKIPVNATNDVPHSSNLTLMIPNSNTPANPKTPTSSRSRLPRPSTKAPPIQSTSSTASTAQTQLKTKNAKQNPTIPLGGRMTRSASLRQKDRKEDPTPATEASKPLKRSGTRTNMSKPRAPAAVNQAPQPVVSIPKATASTPVQSVRKRSNSSSYAQATTSSIAKVTHPPSSPIKPHSVATTSHIPPQRFNLVSRASQPPSSSTLSRISSALDRLKQPPPERPNTSLGFNRAATTFGDDEGLAEKSSKPALFQDDTGIGRRQRASSVEPRPQPLKRASTVGSLGAGSSAGPSRLMLPPPVPKGRNDTTTSTSDRPAQNKINLHSGIVVGKPKGNFTFGLRQPTGGLTKPRMFGVGALTGMARSRVVHRASRETSLPTVEGSPVKGGGVGGITSEGVKTLSEDDDMEMVVSEPSNKDDNIFLSKAPASGTEDIGGSDLDAILAGVSTSDNVKGKGKEKSDTHWNDPASQRASMASQLLSQSLSALPQTPTRIPSKVKEYRPGTRAGLRSSSSTYPSGSKPGAQTAPGALENGGSSSGAHVSAHAKGAGDTNGTSPPGSADSKKASLKILKSCKIFVDVRTEDGDDAGALFVDMLRGLGAKILSRVGLTCTHIVWKNGLTSTQSKYRLLDDPKPLVVGIGWVVDCVEKRTRVDETDYAINLELVNVAGTTKRRRSMLPKHLSGTIDDVPSVTPAETGNTSIQSVDSSDRSAEIMSPNVVVEASPATSEDSLPPLERARRRRSNFFAPRT